MKKWEISKGSKKYLENRNHQIISQHKLFSIQNSPSKDKELLKISDEANKKANQFSSNIQKSNLIKENIHSKNNLFYQKEKENISKINEKIIHFESANIQFFN